MCVCVCVCVCLCVRVCVCVPHNFHNGPHSKVPPSTKKILLNSTTTLAQLPNPSHCCARALSLTTPVENVYPQVIRASRLGSETRVYLYLCLTMRGAECRASRRLTVRVPFFIAEGHALQLHRDQLRQQLPSTHEETPSLPCFHKYLNTQKISQK